MNADFKVPLLVFCADVNIDNEKGTVTVSHANNNLKQIGILLQQSPSSNFTV